MARKAGDDGFGGGALAREPGPFYRPVDLEKFRERNAQHKGEDPRRVPET